MMVGAVLTTLTDKFGRKRTLFISGILQAISAYLFTKITHTW
jgi:hypothetical protein